MLTIRFKVNGKWRQIQVSDEETLARVLREKLDLAGTKLNCERGECGVCTVLLDGKAVNSCLILAASIDGHEVTTIEGLGAGGELDAIQEAFLQEDASQCGYCTPGMILSAKALLLINEAPTESEIKEALSGNLCRCTGYTSIIRAVKRAAMALEKSKHTGGDLLLKNPLS